MIKGKKILITGGAGFLGTHLIRKLIERNRIIVYDNLRRNSIKNTDLLSHPNLQLIVGDVLDFEKLKYSVKDCNITIHMAAIAGIDTVIKSPTTTMEVNMLGTYNILKAVKPYIKNIERFVYFSTSEVFGSYTYRAEEKHSTDLQPVGEVRWTYAVSKLAGEHLANSYYKEFGLPIVLLRPFNVYGPGQVGEGAIHVFIKRAINNQIIEIHGDGDQIRSWCYIDDMVDAILLVLEKHEAIGNVFNIGNPKGTITIRDLAEKIARLANSESQIVHVPKSYVDVELRIPSIDKAKEILGYQPKVDLDNGLNRTIEWYRRQ